MSESSSICIYRVGRELRELRGSAYTPRLVSIGPFHSKDEYLKKRSGNIKLSYMKSLFDRIRKPEKTDDESDTPEQCLKKMVDEAKKWYAEEVDAELNEDKSDTPEQCLKKMVDEAKKWYAEEVDAELNEDKSDTPEQCLKKMVDEAKKCYAEEVDAELNEEMMLIDGCFILEFLYRYAEAQKMGNPNQSESLKSGDPIFGSVPTRRTVQDDLLLLENQLPFFVLQTLYNLTLKKLQHPLLLCEYVNQIIPKFVPVSNSENYPTANSKNNPTKSGSLCECCVILFSEGKDNEAAGEDHSKKEHPLHILDFIHKKYRPPHVAQGKDDEEKINTCSMYSASDLHCAGVKFEAPAEASDNIFKVNFSVGKCPLNLFRRARFQIPTLLMDDSTERRLRNLIAFEQCHPRVECYVTSYAFLMDRLINTEKDVEVLQKAGVLRHYLRANEEASDIFNKLYQEVELGGFSYAWICEEAARYSERWWPEFMASVRYTYFSKPWTFLAFCIAFIAFGATLGNFILNLSRRHPPKE